MQDIKDDIYLLKNKYIPHHYHSVAETKLCYFSFYRSHLPFPFPFSAQNCKAGWNLQQKQIPTWHDIKPKYHQWFPLHWEPPDTGPGHGLTMRAAWEQPRQPHAAPVFRQVCFFALLYAAVNILNFWFIASSAIWPLAPSTRDLYAAVFQGVSGTFTYP